MWRCPGCGHHHGTHEGWVKCGAITYPETGGVARCGCTTPDRQDADQ